jgi:hypothetical protein
MRRLASLHNASKNFSNKRTISAQIVLLGSRRYQILSWGHVS